MSSVEITWVTINTWWRHQMETFPALLALCAGNSPVAGEFPAQRPVTRRFDVFFDLRLNKPLSKQSWGWCSETPSSPLCQCNGLLLRDLCYGKNDKRKITSRSRHLIITALFSCQRPTIFTWTTRMTSTSSVDLEMGRNIVLPYVLYLCHIWSEWSR